MRLNYLIQDAYSRCRNGLHLATAHAELKKREGAEKDDGIGVWEPGKVVENDPFLRTIGAWARELRLDGVVWTALGHKHPIESKRPARPTCSEVIDYLSRLKGVRRRLAEDYVRKAPLQIDTAYRREIEAKLGWTPPQRTMQRPVDYQGAAASCGVNLPSGIRRIRSEVYELRELVRRLRKAMH